MLKGLISLFSGIIFAIGLVISGMTNPVKVLGFLDVFGSWDYSLVFVLGGAVGLNLITFKFLEKRKPICEKKYSFPVKNAVDKKLIIGSTLFGVGWGLLGICPGPGLVNLVTLNKSAILFMASVLVGMILFKLIERKMN